METAAKTETVLSKDGTPIAVERCGSGPPLVFVHGSTSDHDTAFRFVFPMLDHYFTIHAMDRRGRGQSGDGPRYALERELDDVIAVVESAGDSVNSVNLFGHGFGALLALEASRLTARVGKLAIYEGGITTSRSSIYAPGTVERMEEFLKEDNRDGVVFTFMTEVIRMHTDDLGLLRSQPRWLERLKNAHTIPRELHADRDYRFDPARFANFQVPTLILVGERSPDSDLADAEALANALPNSRVEVLPGQGHAATHTSPEMFAGVVGDFFLD
jgi:pimeloyl-ACP methyl ester carboxylesterase